MIDQSADLDAVNDELNAIVRDNDAIEALECEEAYVRGHAIQSENDALDAILNMDFSFGSLRDIPEWLRTEAVCLSAVTRGVDQLRYVPESARTPAVCLMAVSQDAWSINWVPEHLRDEAICLLAVTQRGHLLRYVPDHLRTANMCKIAFDENMAALEHIPSDLVTPDMAMAARHGFFQFIPERFKTDAFCLSAMRCHSDTVFDLPVERLPSLLRAYFHEHEPEVRQSRLDDMLFCACATMREDIVDVLMEINPVMTTASLLASSASTDRNLAMIDSDLDWEHEYAMVHEFLVDYLPRHFASDWWQKPGVFCQDTWVDAIAKHPFSIAYIPVNEVTRALCDAAFAGKPKVFLRLVKNVCRLGKLDLLRSIWKSNPRITERAMQTWIRSDKTPSGEKYAAQVRCLLRELQLSAEAVCSAAKQRPGVRL